MSRQCPCPSATKTSRAPQERKTSATARTTDGWVLTCGADLRGLDQVRLEQDRLPRDPVRAEPQLAEAIPDDRREVEVVRSSLGDEDVGPPAPPRPTDGSPGPKAPRRRAGPRPRGGAGRRPPRAGVEDGSTQLSRTGAGIMRCVRGVLGSIEERPRSPRGSGSARQQHQRASSTAWKARALAALSNAEASQFSDSGGAAPQARRPSIPQPSEIGARVSASATFK